MAAYRKIETRVWNDEAFAEFEPGDKLLWFALLTHPAMTPMGAGVVSPAMLDEILGNHGGYCWRCNDRCDGECGYQAERSLERFRERSLVFRDNHLVVVKNFLRYNRPDNPNQLAGWIGACEILPRSDVFARLRDHLADEMDGPDWLFDGLLNPLADQEIRGLQANYWSRVKPDGKQPSKRSGKRSPERFGERFPEPSPKPGTGTGTGTGELNLPSVGCARNANDPDESVGGKPRKRFTPPTVEDVATYCRERGNRIDAQRFVDHYESNGWTVGRAKMRDWKAAVRNWERNDFENAKGKSHGSRIDAGQQHDPDAKPEF